MWYKECKNCDYYYKDETVEYCEVNLKDMPKSNCKGEKMITKKFGVDFDSEDGALTLRPADIGTHEDGWTITGEIHEDWFEWVNDFEAIHPTYGKVWGDFENEVYADSEEGYQDFYKNHTPEAWDYGDI